MRNSDNIIDKLFESRIINESREYEYIITFSGKMGSHSRLLKSAAKVDAPKAKRFYDAYCRDNGCVFYSIEDSSVNDRLAKELIKYDRVDKYL